MEAREKKNGSCLVERGLSDEVKEMEWVDVGGFRAPVICLGLGFCWGPCLESSSDEAIISADVYCS